MHPASVLLLMMFIAACMPAPTPMVGETSALTPTIAMMDSAQPTPTGSLSQDTPQPDALLVRYVDELYGIAFEYPAVYDEPPYKDAGCGVEVAESGDERFIYIGHRIIIAISPSSGRDLAADVDDFTAARELVVTDRTDQTVAGVEAVRLAYRFGGMNRLGLVTFFAHGEWLYGASITAGAFCEMLAPEGAVEIVYTEFQVYELILESFEFIR
jgi:hypothetical protein